MTATCRCWCGCGRRDLELDDATSSLVECVPCLTGKHKRLPPDKTCPTCGAAWNEPYRKVLRESRRLAPGEVHAYITRVDGSMEGA